MVGVGREEGGDVSEAVLKVAIYMMREVRASKIKIVHLQAKVVYRYFSSGPKFFHWRTANGQPIEGLFHIPAMKFSGEPTKKKKQPNHTFHVLLFV